jgi:hypothetical protein
VARPRNPALAVRNDQIYAEWRSGWSLTRLAEKYSRTPQVIGRIVAAYHPDLEDDTDRALHRGRLESLYGEVQEVVEAPGWKMAPNGRLAEDADGNPLVDVGAKIEALKLKLMVLESARKLDARDKPQRSHVTVDVARQEADAALAAIRAKIAADNREMEALRRQVAVIPGEVVRELPPGGA